MNEQWITNKFEGLTRAELKQAGEELGVNFGPNILEKTMRIRLCEKLGEGPVQSIEAPPAPVRLQRMQRPRLAPGDDWEGRRHDVKVHRSRECEEHKAFVLYWNFVPRSFAYDVLIHMPEPYFEILKVKIGRIVQEPILDKFNFRTGTLNREVFTPRYSFDYYGLTKGTEDLPGSILEYWQREAIKRNYFRELIHKNTGRNRLIQIRSDLMGSAGPAFYKDLTNEDIWQDIIRFLGFEDIFYTESDEDEIQEQEARA